MTDKFMSFHPLVSFFYFTAVLSFSMLFLNPACIIFSFIGAISYFFILKGKKGFKFLAMYIPVLIITSLINPIFNHQGVTIILYFKNGNPLTLEAVIFGIFAAIMLISVVLWFYCLGTVITSDKIIYLTGRLLPGLSLFISMTLRFVPKFISQFKKMSLTQKALGLDIFSGSIKSRVKNAIKILSAMISYSLENSLDTAESMKSRGFGLPGRTAFSLYTLTSYDKFTLLWIILSIIYISFGGLFDVFYFSYFPAIKKAPVSFYGFTVFLVYVILLAMPLIINLLEAIKWKNIKSGI